MIIATVMVTAVAFVVTFQSPPAPNQGARGIVAASAQDALNILGDEPVTDSTLGTNAMSVSLMECLQGDCSRLTDKMSTLLPHGVRYAVYLSNGYGTYPVYEPQAPTGEAVSAQHLLEPDWSWSFVAPSLPVVNPTEDPVQIYDIPIVDSNVVTQQGNLLDIVVHGVRSGDNATYVQRTSVSTREAANASAGSTPAVSLYFVDGSGNPLASQDVRSQTITAPGVRTLTPVALTLRVNETAGVAIPAGANVTVLMPRGWNASASTALNPAWTIVSNATDTSGSAAGSALVASLKSALSGATADLKINVTYDGDINDHYVIRAAMSRGALANAALLVRGDNQATLPPFETPGVYVSAPNPMGATATTTWTLATHVSQSSVSGVSDSVVVTEIDVTEESGARLFGAVTPITSGGGAWTSNGTALVWTGNVTVSHSSPLNLTFQLAGLGAGSATGGASPFWPSVAMSGWSGRVSDASSPGVFRQAFLPSGSGYYGYNSSTGAWVEDNHTGLSESIYRGTSLPGSFGYSAGYGTGLRDALFGSDLAPVQRHVAVGTNATVGVNVQSLAYQLAELGFKPVVKLNLYPPWAGDTRTPIWSTTLYDAPAVLGNATLLSVLEPNNASSPQASSIGRYNATVPIGQSWLFGPYILDAEVDWNDTLSAVVAGHSVSAPIARSAHVYDYVQVTPPSLLTPASPLYNARLVVWFDDWR
ncbi:MAG: hypothetical protein QOE90_3283 [Thermoplasmata archaeon]|jgi:hypothetical protein|nr:hypothetical protein [Thermoplasmata archaeon]